MNNNKVFKNAALVCTAVVITLTAAEMLLSAFIPAPQFEELNITHEESTFHLSQNPRLIYVPKANVGEHNSYGHRGKEFSVEKKDKTRILFMGDSVVEGLGVNTYDRFTEILDSYLEKAEVINFGVKGYNLVQELEYFKEKGLAFNPDHVFWGITYNDMYLDSGTIDNLSSYLQQSKNNGFYIQHYATGGKVNDFLMKSNIYRYINALILTKRNFKNEVIYRIDENYLVHMLAEMRDLSIKYNFELTFVFLPVNTELYKEYFKDLKDKQNRIEKVVKELNFPMMNLNEMDQIVDMGINKRNLFLDNDPCHLNVFGNKVVANLIYGQIKTESAFVISVTIFTISSKMSFKSSSEFVISTMLRKILISCACVILSFLLDLVFFLVIQHTS